jgi:hypothetical protein
VVPFFLITAERKEVFGVMDEDTKKEIQQRLSKIFEKNLDEWIIDFVNDAAEARKEGIALDSSILVELELDADEGDAITVQFDTHHPKRVRRHTVVVMLDSTRDDR